MNDILKMLKESKAYNGNESKPEVEFKSEIEEKIEEIVEPPKEIKVEHETNWFWRALKKFKK